MHRYDALVKTPACRVQELFEADRTYYVLFVYATPTTRQTYQLWVGAGLPANWADQNVWLARVFPETTNFRIITKDDHTMWPPGWERTYDPGTGILTVTIDMGFDQFKTEYAKAQQDFCLPASFCTFGSSAASATRRATSWISAMTTTSAASGRGRTSTGRTGAHTPLA